VLAGWGVYVVCEGAEDVHGAGGRRWRACVYGRSAHRSANRDDRATLD